MWDVYIFLFADKLLEILDSFKPTKEPPNGVSRTTIPNTNPRLFIQQTWAALTLNARSSLRNRALLLSQLLVPVAVLSFTLTWIQALPKVHKPSPRQLDINLLYSSVAPYSFTGNRSAALAKAFVQQFTERVGQPLVPQKHIYLCNCTSEHSWNWSHWFTPTSFSFFFS